MNTIQDYDLLVLLAETGSAVFEAWQQELNQYHISTSRAAALLVIEAIGGQATPSEISRRLFRAHHTVLELTSRMEAAGLVSRVKDPDRTNGVRVVLTDRGRYAYRQSIRQESVHRIMASLSEEERQQLRSSLQTLRDKAVT